MSIDLGGIAKGAFADVIAGRLAHWPGGLVDAGGDMRAWGAAGDGGPWRISIEDPLRPDRDLATATLADPALAGGIATSGVLRRHWGDGLHHLIDPATGAPLAGGLAAVTVFAPTCAVAEIAAKSLLVAAAGGKPLAWNGFARAVAVTLDGETLLIEGGDGHAAILDHEMDAVAVGDHRP